MMKNESSWDLLEDELYGKMIHWKINWTVRSLEWLIKLEDDLLKDDLNRKSFTERNKKL